MALTCKWARKAHIKKHCNHVMILSLKPFSAHRAGDQKKQQQSVEDQTLRQGGGEVDTHIHVSQTQPVCLLCIFTWFPCSSALAVKYKFFKVSHYEAINKTRKRIELPYLSLFALCSCLGIPCGCFEFWAPSFKVLLSPPLSELWLVYKKIKRQLHVKPAGKTSWSLG